MSSSQRKIFVLDTSVILYDVNAIHNFQEHDVAIPITVLEELDHVQEGQHGPQPPGARVHPPARQALRRQHARRAGSRSTGRRSGKFRVLTDEAAPVDASEVFGTKKADHRILNAALSSPAPSRERQVILVSKDINLRLKARALNLPRRGLRDRQDQGRRPPLQGQERARDRRSGGSSTASTARSRCRAPTSSPRRRPPTTTSSSRARRSRRWPTTTRRSDRLERVQQDRRPTASRRATPSRPSPCTRSSTRRCRWSRSPARRAPARRCWRSPGRSSSAAQFRQIYLARPIVPLSNRDIGFLPGDIKSKINPYMQPLWDNLGIIKNQFGEREPGVQADRRDGGDREAPHHAARLHPRPQPLERHLHRRRGAEPDAARGEDDHHARRRGDQDRPHRRHLPDRHALPRRPQQRPLLPDRPHEGQSALRPRQPGEGRALARSPTWRACCSRAVL